MAEQQDEYLPSSLRPIERQAMVPRIVILVGGLLIAAGLGGIYYRWHAKQKAEAVAVVRRILGDCPRGSTECQRQALLSATKFGGFSGCQDERRIFTSSLNDLMTARKNTDEATVISINGIAWVTYQENGVFAKFVNEVTLKREIASPSRPGRYNYCAPDLRKAFADHLESIAK